MRIEHAQKDIRIIGFDSAWADKSPGAICALEYDKSGRLSLQQPGLVNFEKGSEFILKPKARYSCTLVAMDQPTIVQNKTGMRPVERVVASLMGFTGGGVQPANTSKTFLFGPYAPIREFKSKLKANEDAEKARLATDGLHLIEVFPALALAGLNEDFAVRFGSPKYNPSNRKFNLQHWNKVAETLAEKACSLELTELAQWASNQARCSRPSKGDQDRLDAALCALIGAIWRVCDRSDSVMIGDLKSGYMVSPVSEVIRRRLTDKARGRDVRFC